MAYNCEMRKEINNQIKKDIESLENKKNNIIFLKDSKFAHGNENSFDVIIIYNNYFSR